MFRGYGEQTRLAGGHRGKITSVVFSPRATHLATAASDGKTCIWDVSSCTLVCVYQGDSPTLSISWIPRRDNVLLCGLANGYIVSLFFSSSEVRARGLIVHSFPVECLATSGSRVASGAHRELRIWEWQDGDGPWYYRADIPEPSSGAQEGLQEVLVTSVHWSRKQLIVTYLNHGIRIYEAPSWGCVREIPVDGHIVRAALSSDRSWLVASNLMTGFDLYDLNDGTLVRAFGHEVGEKRATPIKFIESDAAIIGGSTVGTATIWDANTGRRLHTISHSGSRTILALDACYDRTRNHFLIATGTADDSQVHSVVLWRKKNFGDYTSESERPGEVQVEQKPRFTVFRFKIVAALCVPITLGIITMMYCLHNQGGVGHGILPRAEPREEDPYTRWKRQFNSANNDGDDVEDSDNSDDNEWEMLLCQASERRALSANTENDHTSPPSAYRTLRRESDSSQRGSQDVQSVIPNEGADAEGDLLVPPHGGVFESSVQDTTGQGVVWKDGLFPVLMKKLTTGIGGGQ